MVWQMSTFDPSDRDDPMNMVFPKVAKCTFTKSGPTGTIQTFDGLCVLPINIINEKIYLFMWFWFIILAIITAIFMVYRYESVNQSIFQFSTISPFEMKTISYYIVYLLLSHV